MSGKKQRGHVPYRDMASQSLMKKMHEREPASQDPEEVASHGTQEEPEVEPEEGLPRANAFPDIPDDDDDFPDDAADDAGEQENLTVDVVDLPDTVYPTLDEYKERWDRKLAQHSKPAPGDFSHNNLVPEPIPALWQDCPYRVF